MEKCETCIHLSSIRVEYSHFERSCTRNPMWVKIQRPERHYCGEHVTAQRQKEMEEIITLEE